MTRGRNKPIRPERSASKLLPDRNRPVESVENLLSEKGFCQPTFGDVTFGDGSRWNYTKDLLKLFFTF